MFEDDGDYSNIGERIHEGQVEAMKEENRKSECIAGQVSSFNYDSKGLLTSHQRIWVSYWGGA